MQTISPLVLYLLTALLLGLALGHPVMWLCQKVGWVDKPDARKKHNGAVPLSGGVLILLSVALTALITQAPGYNIGLVVAALLIFAIGFYDDRFPLRARYRFMCHLLAAGLLIFSSEAVVNYLGQCFGPVPVSLGLLAVPFTMVAIPGVINAFNMVDGADGLSGGQLLASVFWLIVAASAIPVWGTAQYAIHDVGPVLLPIAGALLAFLAYNMRGPWRRRAAMFLGDGGSMMLGLVVAWAVILLANSYGRNSLGAASALWIVAVPLFDMFSAIIRRVGEGRTPMSPDRKHLHHLLIERGMSISRAVLALNAIAFCAGAVGVLGWMAKIPQYYLFWAFIGVFALYVAYARRFWQTHDRGIEQRENMFKTSAEQA